MDEGYLRQRRNLISISILLLLTILAGSKINLLFPYAKFERPFIAELFLWIGFSYLWYRTRIYGPDSLQNVLKNETIIKYLINKNPDFMINHALLSFTGKIIITSAIIGDKIHSKIKFHGTNDQGNPVPSGNGRIETVVDNSKNEILSKRHIIHTVIHGKSVTDYYLPHCIAFIVLIAGMITIYDMNTWIAVGIIEILFIIDGISKA